jgi:hypothetical protein
MNRIEELKKQAMVKEYGHGCWGESESHDVLDPDKLAELIIKECVACAYWIGKFNTEPALPAATAQAFSLRIKTHFGVDDEQEY